MKLSELRNQKLRPLRSLIAFVWLKKSKTEAGILIPDSYWSLGFRIGKYSIGKVLATGPKVRELKKNDLIMFGEYSMIGEKGFVEDEIYFTEEKEIPAKVSGIKGLIFRGVPKDIEAQAERA